jgi:small-conductance mechanosensitive channel
MCTVCPGFCLSNGRGDAGRATSGARRVPTLGSLALAAMLAWAPPAAPQEPGEAPTVTAPADSAAPVRVELDAEDDAAITGRIEAILLTAEEWTGWLESPRVRVERGIVHLTGRARSEERKAWAGELARSTEGVVTVVNQLEVEEAPLLDFAPALVELRRLRRGAVQNLATVGVGLLVLLSGLVAAAWAARLSRRLLAYRVESGLLRGVLARGIGFLVLIVAFYIALQVIGLTRLAVTVIGGTGLVGLVVGIAFRDITENFLASVFLSMQRPFRSGDLVEIAGTLGYVQRLTTRATVLMALDGNHVQIPNAAVYKSTIRNFTSNPNRREDFAIGIGYEDCIPDAQQVALQVLARHPAVLRDPEPWVLAENLGAATVSLRVYFWLDGSRHSWMKVRSSVIRLVKRAFQEAGISLPDEAREVIFPRPVPVRMLSGEEPAPSERRPTPAREPAAEPDVVATDAESGLHSEAGQIHEQARHSRTPEEGEDLLRTRAAEEPDHPRVGSTPVPAELTVWHDHGSARPVRGVGHVDSDR